jgi:limonene-1,2-epoxide hydrolase
MMKFDRDDYGADTVEMPAVVDPAPVRLFKEAFARLGPTTEMSMDELYDPDVEFMDPFQHIRGRAELAAYFRRLNARVESATFEFTDRVVEDDRAALSWVMTAHTKRPRQTVVLSGVSLLRYTDRIVSHRDYFDVGEMLYERIPGLWRVLRWVKRKAG